MHPPVPAPIELVRQQLSAPLLIVHVLDQRVLDRNSASRCQKVTASGIEKLADLPTRIDRNQVVPEVIIRRMQRHGERHRHSLAGELLDRGNQSDGRHRDVACAHAEALGRRIDQPMQRSDNRLVVGQRLPHPHKDHVGQGRGPSRQRPVAARCLRGPHLIHDLSRREVASQTHLSRRAERTGHAAARLGRDAQSRTLGVAHEHRLDLSSVVESPQVLDRAPSVRLERDDLRHQVRQERLGHGLAHPGWNVAHPRRIGLEMRKVVAGELIGSKGREAEVLHDLLARGAVKVSQVRWCFASALGRKGQHRLGVPVSGALRGLVGGPNLPARRLPGEGDSRVATSAVTTASSRGLDQWLDSHEIPGSAHAKMK